jgi:hypothetical protein
LKSDGLAIEELRGNLPGRQYLKDIHVMNVLKYKNAMAAELVLDIASDPANGITDNFLKILS